MNYNISEMFINNLYSIAQTDFSDATINHVKKCLLDYLGVTLAGSKIIKKKGEKLLAFSGGTEGAYTAIGFNKKVNIYDAVLINGLSSHVLELDDGIRLGAMHPGAPIISAILPIAEENNIGSKKLIAGIIVGYEAAIRLARSIQPSHAQKGYHTTATCGTIGAAIAVSVALDFSKKMMKDALASATISAMGTLKVLEDASELKPYNVGKASLLGVTSVNMSQAGFVGPEDPLSGNDGFLNMMADNYETKYLFSNEDIELYIKNVYFKLYSACRHCHSPIEAALRIREKRILKENEIKEIKVIAYNYVMGRHDHRDVKGISSAKMSIPYCVAVALYLGRVNLEDFNLDLIKNPSIISLMNKVIIVEDEEINKLVPDKRPAIVCISTYDGEYYEERVDYPKGEPENPVSEQEIKDKFKSLALNSGKSEKEILRIIDCVTDIENKLDKLYKTL